MSTLDAAVAYHARGWVPIPLLPRDKRPAPKAWPDLRPTSAELLGLFAGQANVGIHLGPSGVVDIDLDCPEAVALAPALLPSTTLRFGRDGAPGSHWLYRCPGADYEKLLYGRETLLEVRAGEGKQTVLPPSVHPTGQVVRWESGVDSSALPTEVTAFALSAAARRTAAGCLLLREGWTQARVVEALNRSTPPQDLPGGPAGDKVREWCGWPPVARAPRGRTPASSEDAKADFREAAAAYLRDNPVEYPSRNGNCPVCDGKGCFKASNDRAKWTCWHPGHQGVGLIGKGGDHWSGDALDLDAHAAGMSVPDFLRDRGYLKAAPPPRSTPATGPAPTDRHNAPKAPDEAALAQQGVDALKAALTAIEVSQDATEKLNAIAAVLEVRTDGLHLGYALLQRELEVGAILTRIEGALGKAGPVRRLENQARAARASIVNARPGPGDNGTGGTVTKMRPRAELDKVRELLEHTDKGGLQSNITNRTTIFREDPRWSGLRYDAFADRVYVGKHELDDVAITGIGIAVHQDFGLTENPAQTHEAIVYVAKRYKKYHPLQDRLRGLRWDGVKRLDSLLCTYLGAEDTSLHRAYSRRFGIQAIARALQPGCKADAVLALHGRQGQFKSTALRMLALHDEWFEDARFNVTKDQDTGQKIQGIWIYEVKEFESFRGQAETTLKGFIDQREDRYRPPYGRVQVRQPRQCVFVITTNEHEFLRDPTGSRRFWACSLQRDADVAAIKRDREQIWAEAFVAWQAKERWHLNPEEERDRQLANEQFTARPLYYEPIRTWVEKTLETGITMYDIMTKALQKDPDQWSRGDEIEVGKAMAALGYRVTRPKGGDPKRPRVYVRDRDVVTADDATAGVDEPDDRSPAEIDPYGPPY